MIKYYLGNKSTRGGDHEKGIQIGKSGNVKSWESGVKSRYVHTSENDLFSRKIHVWFSPRIKFSWTNNNHILQVRLIFNLMIWGTPVISGLRRKKKTNEGAYKESHVSCGIHLDKGN